MLFATFAVLASAQAQSEWIEKSNGDWERDFQCKIEISEKTSPNVMDALPAGQPFTMKAEANETDIKSVNLKFVSPEHDKPLIMESHMCLSDPLELDNEGMAMWGGETFQCAVYTSGDRFATLYAPQEEGWFTIVVVNGGAIETNSDPDTPMPSVYYDTYRGKCM